MNTQGKSTMSHLLAFTLSVGLAAVAVAGCVFDPPNGKLQCNAGPKQCPDNYECAQDNLCYKRGQAPSFVDMSVAQDLAIPKIVKLHGQTCNTDTDICDSGEPCIDGVCCESACADPCKACNVDGQLGSCVAVPGGKMPVHGSCNADAVSTCGHNGTCDGAGVCALFAAGTACGTGACDTATGDFQPSPECDGLGVCKPLGPYNCSPYKCKDATSCSAPPCTDSSTCSGTNSCVNMSCGLLMLGRTCTAGNQCTGGNCVDGVCCDSACTGQCAACDLPDGMGNKGHCQQVMGAPRGGRTACTGTATTCGGTCGTKQAACDYPSNATACGSACASATTVTAALCSGAGACNSSTVTCPNNFACVGTACKTQCAVDSDCDSRYFCNTTLKTCVSKCTNATQDNGESDIDCGGANCAPCKADLSCALGTDCASGVCSNPIMGRCRAAVSPPGWDTVSQASMNYGRERHQLVTSKGKMYAIGGYEWYVNNGYRASRSYEVYTPSYLTSNSGVGGWTLGPSPTSDLQQGSIDLAAVALPDGTIHTIGGYYEGMPDVVTKNHSYLLPPATIFTTGTVTTTALSGGRAAVGSDGSAYYVGGGQAPDTAFACVNSVYKLTAPNTWSTGPSMPGATRCNFALVPDATGTLWAFFGRNATNGTAGLTGYASWKPGDATWVVNNGGYAGMGFNNTGALGTDGRIYLYGGQNAGAPIAADHRWTRWKSNVGLEFLPAPPAGMAVASAAAAQGPDGRIYINGGVSSVGGLPTEYTSVWGPKITVSTVTPASGGTVFVTLKNFAAAATVSLYWDTVGTAITSTPAVTDASGNYTGTISFTVPTSTSGTVHKIIAMDPKSEYPVWAVVTIP